MPLFLESGVETLLLLFCGGAGVSWQSEAYREGISGPQNPDPRFLSHVLFRGPKCPVGTGHVQQSSMPYR